MHSSQIRRHACYSWNSYKVWSQVLLVRRIKDSSTLATRTIFQIRILNFAGQTTTDTLLTELGYLVAPSFILFSPIYITIGKNKYQNYIPINAKHYGIDFLIDSLPSNTSLQSKPGGLWTLRLDLKSSNNTRGSPLVKMPAYWKREGICRTRTWPSATFSRTKWISISMCLVRWCWRDCRISRPH